MKTKIADLKVSFYAIRYAVLVITNEEARKEYKRLNSFLIQAAQ